MSRNGKIIAYTITVALILVLLGVMMEPALAASSSLPPGARMGNGMGRSQFMRGPFGGGFGSPYSSMMDWDERDVAGMGMGMMGPGFMGMGMGMMGPGFMGDDFMGGMGGDYMGMPGPFMR